MAYYYFLVTPFLFAASVCLSRVYEGVHYPRDIAVGSGIGVGLASIYMRFLPNIRQLYKSGTTIERIGALLVLVCMSYCSLTAIYWCNPKTD
jgi:membrane-associated phospholipid phosphatase